MNTEGKEIDLYKVIVDSGKVVFRKKWIILAFFVAGGILGWLKPAEPVFYKTVFHAHSPIIDNEVFKSILLNSENNPNYHSFFVEADTLKLKVIIESTEKVNFDSLSNEIKTTLQSNQAIKKEHDFLYKQDSALLSVLKTDAQSIEKKLATEGRLMKLENYCELILTTNNEPINIGKGKTRTAIGFSIIAGILGTLGILLFHFFKTRKDI